MENWIQLCVNKNNKFEPNYTVELLYRIFTSSAIYTQIFYTENISKVLVFFHECLQSVPFIHIETKQDKVLFHLALSLSSCITLRCHEAIRTFCTLWCDTQTTRVTSSIVLTLGLVTHYFEKKILKKKQVNSNETTISYLFFNRIKFQHT